MNFELIILVRMNKIVSTRFSQSLHAFVFFGLETRVIVDCPVALSFGYTLRKSNSRFFVQFAQFAQFLVDL